MTPEEIISKVYQTCKSNPETIPLVLKRMAMTFRSIASAIETELGKGATKLNNDLDKVGKKKPKKEGGA